MFHLTPNRSNEPINTTPDWLSNSDESIICETVVDTLGGERIVETLQLYTAERPAPL